MKNEDFWDDKSVHNISFISKDNRLFNRLVILPPEFMDHIDNKELEKLIYCKFNQIRRVVSIDEWGEGFSLKMRI